MNDPTESSLPLAASLNEQFVGMQETMTHLQRDVELMHDVMLAQQQELEVLRREVSRLSGRLESLDTSSSDPPRTLEDDRPPHY